MLKILRLLPVLLGLAGLGLAQASPPLLPRPLPYDSLRTTVRQAGISDSARVYHGLIAYQFLVFSSPDTARYYIDQALSLAQHIHLLRGQAEAYGGLAGLMLYAHQNPAAQHYYQQQLRVGQRMRNAHFIGGAYVGMASLAIKSGNTATGLAYYAQARAAYAAARPRDTDDELLLLHNLSNYHLEHHQLAQAVPLVRQAVALLNAHTYPEVRVGVLLLLGTVQQSQQQPDSALATWQRAAQLAHASFLNMQEAEAHGQLAELHLRQHRPAQVVAEARQALALARSSNSLPLITENLQLLAAAMRALHLPAAFDTLQRYAMLRDSLHRQENAQAVAEQQSRFNDAGQQARIRSLEQEQRLARQAEELTRLRALRQLAGVSGLGVLVLALGGLLLWRYRRHQARRDNQLRTRLAADLHDDVGTLLSQISMQSGVLQEGLADPASQRQQLGQISEASRSAVRQLNDVVWSLDAHNDHLPNLLDRMRDYAYEVLSPAGLAVTVEASAGLSTQRLPVLLRRNLYLIYKESLHNILKHAHGATSVSVNLHQEGSRLVLEIRDNGRPAPVALASDEAPGQRRRSGHGLRNVQLRAAAVGGEASSGPETAGPGFRVWVRVPLVPA
jgi:signal transduction histidine kinase